MIILYSASDEFGILWKGGLDKMYEVNNKKRILITLLTVFAIGVSTLGYLLYQGYIWFNNPSLKEFPVRGIDVSAHQGEINWDMVNEHKFSFVFIKATEGKDFKDKKFIQNCDNAKKIGLKTGAYHFFTFSSSGLEQARNFIATVPKDETSLPPVIDIEFSGNSKKILQKDEFVKELKNYIMEVKKYYGKEPILYVLHNSYAKYIEGGFEDNKIWIRDILKYPKLKDNRNWTLWQYSDRGRVKGITGFVDMNIYRYKNLEEFINGK